jgi:TonB family protein
MKSISQRAPLVLLLSAVAVCAQTPHLPEDIWKEFSSATGRFKVVLPGKPEDISRTIETGKLLSMTEISLDGYPGREFRVERPDSIFRMRYYLVGGRFYQIAIITPTSGFISADLQRLAKHLEKRKEDDLAKLLAENDPDKIAAGIARSLELIVVEFFDSFKVTPPSPAPEPQPKVSGAAPKIVPGGVPAGAPGGVAIVDDKTPPPAPKKITVSGGVLQGTAIKRVQPPYPQQAKEELVQGAVQLQVTISEEGKVIDAVVLSGPELLREAALEAAKKWEFKSL